MKRFKKTFLFLMTVGLVSLGGCEVSPLPPDDAIYYDPVYSPAVYDPYPYYYGPYLGAGPYWGGHGGGGHWGGHGGGHHGR